MSSTLMLYCYDVILVGEEHDLPSFSLISCFSYNFVLFCFFC